MCVPRPECSTSSTFVVVLDFITRGLFVVPFGRSVSCNRQWVTSNGSNRNVLLTALLSFRPFYPSMVHRPSYWTRFETNFWLFKSAEYRARGNKKEYLYIGYFTGNIREIWRAKFVPSSLTPAPFFNRVVPQVLILICPESNICHEFDDWDRRTF